MRVRPRQPPPFRVWLKDTAVTLLLLALLPSLLGAAVIARHAANAPNLEVRPPRTVLHESP